MRYKKIPEGISPAPGDVQKKMDECLIGIEEAIAYLDNIYVTGRTYDEHKRNLEEVCKRLNECNLRLNLKKCKFMQERIEVLGFVIDREGLHKYKSRVKAMVEAPTPTNGKELESFLGLITFYARFLKKRSANLKPLYDLLNQEFVWNEDCEKAFRWVKDELISDEFLAHYDPNRKIILACDACDYGLSAILSHEYDDGTERPIAFVSKKIPLIEQKRSIIDKEAMAIVFGFKRFYQFVFGKKIKLRTDNKALQLILGPRKGLPVTAGNRLQRYAYYLSGYAYEIEHVKSNENANCDALSRLPIEDDTDLSDIVDPVDSHVYFFENEATAFDCKMLASQSMKDAVIGRIIRYVTGDWPNCDELSAEERIYFNRRFELAVEKGCLFWGIRACIPVAMRPTILRELHSTHFGIVKIKMFARSYVWWPGIDTAIENVVNACKTCVVMRKKPPKTPLTTWPWPNKVWGRIHCDYAGPFYGDMYLIVVDAHSKWPEIFNCGKNTKAVKLIELFKTMFTRYGLPIH